ncbi:BRO-N domain-containing protein [Pseudomonas piscis]|uniref:BRO-N domain-containing protein n=1 Tax=Pseudomonas piscis TaxID=2614538 RepID=UPI0021D5A919|nr:BRO family protein [Pseudomonas piscis]MCU7649716.1 BRO family protein [Pseudomonas piscis]
MGIELDVLTGHPEHELLFVATQVARAAGLKDPSAAIRDVKKKTIGGHFPLVSLLGNSPISLPKEPNGYSLRTTTVIMTEPVVNQILFRGHAPASEPFRKWGTEEVLPSIRKTGKYNAETSTNPIAIGVIDELKTLSGEVVELKSLIKEVLVTRPVATVVVAAGSVEPQAESSAYLPPEV